MCFLMKNSSYRRTYIYISVAITLAVVHVIPMIAYCKTINSVNFEHGVLKVQAQQMPLQKILQRVATLTKVKIKTENLKTKMLIDADIQTKNLDYAVAKLLRGVNYRVIANASTGKISEVVLYGQKENSASGAGYTGHAGAEKKQKPVASTHAEPVEMSDVQTVELVRHNKKEKEEDTKQNTLRFVPNQLMVRFAGHFSREDAEKELSKSTSYPFTLEETALSKLNYYKVNLSSKENDSEVLEKLSQNSSIVNAEPDFILDINGVEPNDTKYSSQWGLTAIGAPEAWLKTVGDSDIVVAVIDTGVEYTHPDLSANIWENNDEIADNGIDDDDNGYVDDVRGYDFVTISDSYVYEGEDPGPSDNDPIDVQGHGTHVAGTVAAEGNNGMGVSGVSWAVSIMPVRAGFKNTSGGGSLLNSNIVNAIMYAADNGANVISMSFGSSYNSSTQRTAVEYAASKGVILVAAAGNSNSTSKHYPAAYDDVISVGSTSSTGKKSSFSNYGDWVDISAPGSGIISTYLDGTYRTMSGTSMATPMLSGAAALLLSYNSSLTASQVKSILVDTSDNVVESIVGEDPQIGGQVNILNAMESKEASNGAVPGGKGGLPVGSQNVPTMSEMSFIITALMLCMAACYKNRKALCNA